MGFAWSSPALAWGDFGHRILCEIAFQELSDRTRQRVKTLIRRDPEFETFAEFCSWPDHPRHRAEEHYVNLPGGAEGFIESPCPLADKCVISAIEKDLAALSSSGVTEQEKLEALKYFGHWVGDVHQPLHVSFEDDRGGNEVGISGGLCSWDLHSVWDSCIIEEGPGEEAYAIARDLLDEVTDDDRRTWRASGPIDWANASFAISIRPEVGYCVRVDSGCWYDAQNQRLDHRKPERMAVIDRAYIETNTPTVRDRLVKAGVRLGDLLNQALGTEQREALHSNR